jgi:hypothetical protein
MLNIISMLLSINQPATSISISEFAHTTADIIGLPVVHEQSIEMTGWGINGESSMDIQRCVEKGLVITLESRF